MLDFLEWASIVSHLLFTVKMNIVIQTWLSMKKEKYEMHDFLAEVIEKYEHLEDAILEKMMKQAEKDETVNQEQLFASLEKLWG